MAHDPHGTRNIPVGTPVVAANGRLLGKVREAYPHYILVDQDGLHLDLEVPVHAVLDLSDGVLRVSVNREALTEVDHEETAHHLNEDGERPVSS